MNGPSVVPDALAAALEERTARARPRWDTFDWSQGLLRWRSFRLLSTSLPHQGWKIHVSAAAVEAADACARIVPMLLTTDAAFKVPRGVDDVAFINSGDGGAALMGKVITIYPNDAAQAWRLAGEIDALWPASRGPEVQSDVHLRPGSAVSMRFGVFGIGPIVTSSAGVHEFALIAPDGTLVPDVRGSALTYPAWVSPPPVEIFPPRPCPIALRETATINGHRYLPLAVMSDKPTTRIFLGVAVESRQTVVLKVGRPGAAGDARGHDLRDKLRREFDMLSTLSEPKRFTPRAIDWCDDEWPVAVYEDFRGAPVSELSREVRVACLVPLAEALASLHAAGVVHGDIKLENAIRRESGVGLIDFEMGAQAGEAVHAGGTTGHLGPEVRAGMPAAFSRDIYALGGCVAQAVLGIPPGLLPGGTNGLRELLLLEGADTAADLVDRFCMIDPDNRPDATAAVALLVEHQHQLAGLAPSSGHPSTATDIEWCRTASLAAGSRVHDYVERDGEGQCWRNEHFMRAFHGEAINIGAAGIVLGLASIARVLKVPVFDESIRGGASWLTARSPDGQSAGLFTGNAGVAVALSLAARRFEDSATARASVARLRHAAADQREFDLFSGAAGVLLASCAIAEIEADDAALGVAAPIVTFLRRCARVKEHVPVWAVEDTDEHYVGCAHGSAGVGLALALWGRKTGDRASQALALETFSAIYAHARTADGRATRMTLGADRAHAVGTWCHGVAGYLWAMVYAFGDHPALQREIDWAVEVVCDSMTVGTPTYCHGLAGRLELWRMLGNVPRFSDLADRQAGKTVRALRTLHQGGNDRIGWCSDDPLITTPDLWIGFLGPASALALHASASRAPLLSGEWLSLASIPD